MPGFAPQGFSAAYSAKASARLSANSANFGAGATTFLSLTTTRANVKVILRLALTAGTNIPTITIVGPDAWMEQIIGTTSIAAGVSGGTVTNFTANAVNFVEVVMLVLSSGVTINIQGSVAAGTSFANAGTEMAEDY